MPTPQDLTNAGFEKTLSRTGMEFEIWKRQSDGQTIAYKTSNGNIFFIDTDGLGAEPIAMLLLVEMSDIVRQLGDATLGAAAASGLNNRLRAVVPLNPVTNPSGLGI